MFLLSQNATASSKCVEYECNLNETREYLNSPDEAEFSLKKRKSKAENLELFIPMKKKANRKVKLQIRIILFFG